MTLVLSHTAATDIATDLLVIPVTAPPAEDPTLRRLPAPLRAVLLAEGRRRQFTGGRGQECWAHGVAAKAPLVLLLGAGAAAAPPIWYEIADAVVRHAARLHARRVAVAAGGADAEALRALAEGIPLARYRFARYRSRPAAEEPLAVTVAVDRVDAPRRDALRLGAVAAAATALTRDLANTPAQDLAPMDLARTARALARGGLRVRVHDRRALARLRMGAILGVGMGSAQPPCFVEITYRPPRPRRRVALVGKGITFDSGGLSLKTADAMQAQKRDMAGAAVVLGVMSALPALRLPVEVRGFIACAENMPSGSAMRPGDVLRACDGTTIEVLNTDAEGRLVLADALAYAARQRPDCIIDFATLTAVVRTALGPRCAAVLGTDRRLIGELIAAAADANEMLWELPLIEEYRRDIDSRVADIKNVGEGHSGSIVAALFLREFVAGLPWAHVDFSSTVMSDGFACHPKGASGYGVRTMLRWLARFAAHPASGAAVAAARRGTISRPARRA
ncbi:leucyl aminopeptidase [bacterium]|nr:leucyl aminopeptidase [bacterium]